MKLAKGSLIPIYCGVVRDGVPCNVYHFRRESTVGWFMASAYELLTAATKEGQRQRMRRQGWRDQVRPSGQILNVQVAMDAGTLKFWLLRPWPT